MARDDEVLDLWRFDEEEAHPDEQWPQVYPMVRTAILVSVVIGLAVTSYLVIKMDEPYSSFYIVPDSISYSIAENMVSFSYGIFRHEPGKTTYSLNIYAGDKLERTDQHELATGQTGQYHEDIPVPEDASLPLKISLQLNSNRGDTEETHFWLRNSSSA